MVKPTNSAFLVMKILGLPTRFVLGLIKAAWSVRYALRSEIVCQHCNSVMALVRAWRCSCGFTYVGSVLQKCGVCGGRPLMIRCEVCGLTRRIR